MITDEQHAEMFGNASRRLRDLAAQMLQDAPEGIDTLDIATMFLSTGTFMLASALGREAAANYLRDVAGMLDSGEMELPKH